MKRAVITGPTGSIGIALIQELIKHGVEVFAVCREGSGRIGRIPKSEHVHIVECSLSSLTELKDKINEPCDVFYHFAWDGTFGNTRDDMYLQNRNVNYALDAVTAAKALACRTFIGAGSQAEYGRVEGMLKKETPAFPENGYGMAKLCAGQMSRVLCRQLSIRHIWTRILSVYGPYDGENTMIMATIRRLLQKETPSFTKAEQKWDYLYSGDAGRAMYLLGEHGTDQQVYCIGGGTAKPLKQYIMQIRDAIDREAELGIGELPYGENQVMHLCADISNLTADTGFVPEVPFEEGIQRTVSWYRKLTDTEKNR